jgi:hypothetical protein
VEEKSVLPTLLPQAERRGRIDPLCHLGPDIPSTGQGLFLLRSVVSDDSLLLLLLRLDEIERKLDRMMEELRLTAIGYSVGRGALPKKD